MVLQVIKKLGAGTLAVFGLLVLVFLLARLTGDPASLYFPEGAPPEVLAEFAAERGYDRPIVEQLASYLWGTLRLDFGQSILYSKPALTVALERFPATLGLAAATMVLVVLFGFLFGVISAWYEGRRVDRAIDVASSVAISTPDFWLAIMLILLFTQTLAWLPSTSTGGWQSWVMPVLVLMTSATGLLTQVVRSAMVDVLHSEYIVTARAKGIRGWDIVVHHALRNAAIPTLTVAGVLTAGLVNGAVIVESVFGWPGIGRTLLLAIESRDFELIQACVLVTGIAVVFVNVAVELAYAWIDPRVATRGGK